MVCASDLLVSLAGRSTTDEAEIYGTPGIFIPIKNHFEQEENATRFGYSHEDIYRLQELMCEKLDVGRTEIKVSDGAQKAARLIESFLK
jgi:UDP-N-acetylglucosamine--N-acetylmuramyl-(pentapeptide) pyrophosphoryl-undecaprenol N-acetylglucosamine transferase